MHGSHGAGETGRRTKNSSSTVHEVVSQMPFFPKSQCSTGYMAARTRKKSIDSSKPGQLMIGHRLVKVSREALRESQSWDDPRRHNIQSDEW
ncbi:hypothetical protein RB213_002612 [Colletotrichum asianum]